MVDGANNILISQALEFFFTFQRYYRYYSTVEILLTQKEHDVLYFSRRGCARPVLLIIFGYKSVERGTHYR